MEKLITALDKVINLLEDKLTLSEADYEVIDERSGNSVFRGSFDECTDYVDSATPDESNVTEFKFTIKPINN